MTFTLYSPNRARDWVRLLNHARSKPLSTDEFLSRDANGVPTDCRHRLILEEEQEAVAIGQLSEAPFAPSDHLAVLVCTDPLHRNAGHGSLMLSRLEQEALGLGYSGLVATVPEASTSALGWVGRRGFVPAARRFDSVLGLTGDTIDRHRLKTELPPGVTIHDMTTGSEEDWRKLLELFASLVSEAPDMEGLPRWSQDRCRKLLRGHRGARENWILVARDHGEAIGLTVGHAMGGEIYSFFTGVSRPWRGKKIGVALKLHLAVTASAEGIETMRTTNLDRNTSALRMNDALGFRRVPGSIELLKSLSGPAVRFQG